MSVGRFAPSPTGPAHPGTFLSGLLAWLDARSNGAQFVLRLEDIDRQRSKPAFATAMVEDLAWLGLDWDELVVQSERRAEHERALDELAARDLLYGCTCSRATLRSTATMAADGSRLYPGTCRERVLGVQDWRGFDGTVRYRVPDITAVVRQIHGPDRLMHPAVEMGDPVLRRKDGAVTYNLAVVVDDIQQGVTRVVRGRDILPSTGIHDALYREFSAATPIYWHHPLLLEERSTRGDDAKLSKLNGSVGASELRRHLSPEQLCGFLAACVGLAPSGAVMSPTDLLAEFDPGRASELDTIVAWSGEQLVASPAT